LTQTGLLYLGNSKKKKKKLQKIEKKHARSKIILKTPLFISINNLALPFKYNCKELYMGQ
jgi:hypothetical protein